MVDSELGFADAPRSELSRSIRELVERADRVLETEDRLRNLLAAYRSIVERLEVENAQLYEDARRRQRWNAALAEVTASLIGGPTIDPLAVVADGLASVVDADLVAVVVEAPDPDELLIRIARGPRAEHLEGRRFPRLGTLADEALRTGVPVASDAPPGSIAGETALGPTIVLPVRSPEDSVAALSIARVVDAPRFVDSEVRAAAEFAAQAVIAIELNRARADLQRLELVEDRNRIGRDLHDNVIQRLFGIGIGLQGVAEAHPAAAPALADYIDSVDAAIAEIRTAVYTLAGRRRRGSAGLRHRLLDIASEAAETLGATPRLSFDGAIDLLVSADLADELEPVVRECIANASRHGGASRVDVEVVAREDEVVVTVTDDGRGLPARRSAAGGTANLAERARSRGGTFTLADGAGRGAVAVWRVPTPRAEHPR